MPEVIQQTAREEYHAARAALASGFLSTSRVSHYLHRHSAAVDRFTIRCAQELGLPATCALVAVGGYGRGEMFPYSDLDLLVLLPDGHDRETDEKVGAFVTALWDAGITVGSVVRTHAEMIEEADKDVSVSTAFLEARFLWGAEDLFATTFQSFKKHLEPRTFFQQKMLEFRQRHQKFDDTPYALEPDIKECPGGIRDLQAILWCARVAGYGKTWKELSASGLITDTEAFHLGQCEHYLQDLRIRLHLCAKRHEDRLIFDIQSTVAQCVGVEPEGGLDASEVLMKRYYLNAKDIVQLSAILLEALADRLFAGDLPQPPAKPIDEDFQALGDALDITAPDVFARHPHAILRTFYLYATHRELKRLSTRLLRALWHGRYHINAAFRNDKANKELFLETIKLHYGPYHSLKNMNTWGILGRFLPPWRRIVGQMQHDLYHIYTVDQHTLRVVRNLRRYTHASYAHEYPLCSQLISEMPDSWRLTIAGLFHDIGKGRGGNHSEIGAKEVHSFGVNFHMKPEDIDFVEFLVRDHLLMSHVAQKQDTSDPEVVKRFAAEVKTKERLDGLLLLTEADIRATNPKVWSTWKQQLIEDLYESTLRVLQGNDAGSTRATLFANRRITACKLVDEMGVPPSLRDAFWRELDLVYFLRHTPEDIAWHTRELAMSPHMDVPIVRCRRSPFGAGLEILVYVKDQRFLFARVASFFERNGLSILDARIHTTKSGWALDTFLVADRREREDVDELLSWIERQLTAHIAAKAMLPEPKPGKPSRRARSFPEAPVVDIEPDELHRNWLLQITCADRLGLLFAIAVILARHGVNIQTAKVTTLDERAEDVFLIDGPSLSDDQVVVAIETELLKMIGAGHLPSAPSRNPE